MMKPHKLGNPIYDTKELPFQVFPEATLFFAGFLARGADIPPDLDTTQTYFAVAVVAVAVHSGAAFRTRRWHRSTKNPRYAILKLSWVLSKD